ncbi:MAG: branched-chain amino acid ABC transporter permease [Alcaligenaceae bacterium]|jgi:branched-chain amino acid transport system permease protein
MSAFTKNLSLLVGAIALCALPFLVEDFRVFQINLVLIYAIAILGLNILTGFGGQISLGHGAFYAVGAYTSAILITQLGMSSYLTLPIAGLVCLLLGVLMGFPALRLAGHYLALATFALAIATPQLLKYKPIEHYTGGVQGLVLEKPMPPFELTLFGNELSEDRWLYFVILIVGIFLFWIANNLLSGRVGRAIVAIRDQPTAAAALGVNLTFIKTATFGLSAAYTGIAGALSALAVAYIAPDSFPSFLSISLLVGVVVGGLGSIPGAIFGALFIQFVPNVADQISKSAPWAVYGAMLLALAYAAPNGVMGMINKFKKRRKA